jgi:siroheme synthase
MPRHYGLPGKVYLANGGRGRAKQLPSRSIEVLQGADVVFYDGPVSEEVLGLIPARAAVQNAGKLSGAQESSKAELQKRILSAAQSGQTVVLLRGAEASILDRSREEIAALFHAGILFEVIPAAPDNAAGEDPGSRDTRQEIVLPLPPQEELLRS